MNKYINFDIFSMNFNKIIIKKLVQFIHTFLNLTKFKMKYNWMKMQKYIDVSVILQNFDEKIDN